jgi:hypothetical protein
MKKRTKRKRFPYWRVAKLWERGKTIAEIAKATGRIDKGREDGDQYHSLRNFLYRMHSVGYTNAQGELVKLPYRVSKATVRLSSKAGKKASAS